MQKLKLYLGIAAGAVIAVISALFVGRAQGRASEKIKAVKASQKVSDKANQAIIDGLKEEQDAKIVDTSRRDHFE